jgi:hypothetical protein
MRYTGLAARLVFAERFTAAVIDRPFYAGLRMIAARPRVPAAPAPAEPRPAAPLPQAA